MLIMCVILMMIDVVMHRQGRVTWRTTRYLDIKLFCQPLQPLCICSGVVVWAMKVQRFWFTITIFTYNLPTIFTVQLRGALWCKHSKYLQTHTQVVLFAANPHQKMLSSGIFGTDWVANAWRPWKPYMLLKGRAEKTDPRSADYPLTLAPPTTPRTTPRTTPTDYPK